MDAIYVIVVNSKDEVFFDFKGAQLVIEVVERKVSGICWFMWVQTVNLFLSTKIVLVKIGTETFSIILFIDAILHATVRNTLVRILMEEVVPVNEV
jgi:hypothetical protein